MRSSITPRFSAIAVAITGTRWNGISFFGLTRWRPGSGRSDPVPKSNRKRNPEIHHRWTHRTHSTSRRLAREEIQRN